MKTFKLTPEVEQKLSALITELHEVCTTNRIPYVACVVTGNDEIMQQKRISAFINSDEELADNALIAGLEMLKMNGETVPYEVVDALVTKNQMDNGECDCETCRARRAAMAH